MHPKFNKRTPYFLIAPFFICYLLFSVFPFLFSFVISFTDWNGVNTPNFVGLNNYIRMFTQDTAAQKAFFNTFFFLIIAIPIEVILGLLLSILIRDFIPRGRGAFQLLNFLPYLTAPVAVGLIFQFLFDWNYGTINQILDQLNLQKEHIYWLGTEWTARFVVILVIIWRMCGYSMIILTAGLSTIPEDLYEAAELDGATWLQKQIKITLPLLRPILGFVCIISLINGFQLFDDPYMLFASQAGQPYGGPNNSVLTVMMTMFQSSFMNFQMGYGASIAYTLFFIIFAFSIILTRVMKRGGS